MNIKLTIALLLIPFSAAVSQTETVNAEGHYTFKSIPGWRTQLKGSDSYVYAPVDGDMDPWDEKVEFTVAEGEGIELEDAFEFYIKTDFPSAYGKFKLLNQGAERINGLDARWATFTFSAQGVAAGGTGAGDSTLSAMLQAVFYVIKKDHSLFLVNGITEKNLFPKFEPSFRTIIRTFRVKE